jgi:hypothetical protein
MYASMPYILEEAILEIYQERGWDVATSQNRFLVGPIEDPSVEYASYLPRLSDLYAKIDTVVVRKRYDAKIAQDLTAALKARLGSLLHGGKGLMLDTQQSINIETLIERPAILELRRAGDEDERAFVMALIFVLLYEACQNRPIQDSLNHVTLIEEAHRLLRNLPPSTSMESANPRGKTVEMFTDMMAEMRAHGEGFIVVDQMPSKLVPDVIKGSNLKIVHRLMSQDDRLSVGLAMGMKTEQVDYLPRLKKGEAIIHSEELEEACLVLIDSVEDRLAIPKPERSASERENDIQSLLRENSTAFYQKFPELMYKHSACSLCDNPCHYFVGEDHRMLTDTLIGLGQQFLAVAAQGTWKACHKIGTRLNQEMTNRLQDHFGKTYSEGQSRCLSILLAVRSARNFSESYSHAGRWSAVLSLQTKLAKTWNTWPNSDQDLNSLRKLILEQIAIAPATPKPGCAICPRRCWFGFIFQSRNNPVVIGLSEKIRASQPGQRISIVKLAEFVQKHYAERIDSRMLPFAAYCLLSQCSDDDQLLRTFRKQITAIKADE